MGKPFKCSKPSCMCSGGEKALCGLGKALRDFPEHCREPDCLCSGGKGVRCKKGKERNEADREFLMGLGRSFSDE